MLCEVGKGTIRFDPILIDNILNTSLIKNNNSLDVLTYDGYLFFKNPNLKIDIANNIMIAKTKAIKSLQKGLGDKNLKRKIIKMIKRSIDADIKNKGTKLLDNSIQLSFSFNDVDFILRYIIIDLWVYPYSKEIWALYKESKEEQSFPILITPRIQTICYSLFKLIGMLGFNPYKTYVSSETYSGVERLFASSEERIDFKPGKFKPIETDLKNGNGALEYFFYNIIDKMIDSGELFKYLEKKNKLQEKMDMVNYNVEDFKSLEKVFDLLPKYKPYEFIRGWYIKRKKLLQELNM